MEYRCVATTVDGFVQQLSVAYITHGYWFYVVGEIPEGKDPVTVDAKLIERYGIAISKWARCRRKKQGLANMQYLRYGRFFLLLATKGGHEFFERECDVIFDMRRVPIKFAGYSIGCRLGRDRQWHAAVRIDPDEYRKLKAYILELAPHRSVEDLAVVLASLPFEPYSSIRRQALNIWRAANRKRKEAGYDLVPCEAIRLRRRIVRPFARSELALVAA